MDVAETFSQLPLTIDPSTKAVTSSDPALTADIDELNKLHRVFLTLDSPVPPPPAPVNPKRSVQITKLRESGNTSYKKGDFSGAVNLYTLAIRMASERPSWEASGLVREELSALYSVRAKAIYALRNYPEAAVDCECSVELKRVGNIDAWQRRGQCLKDMDRLEEADEWLTSGLEFEGAGPDKQNIRVLETLSKEVKDALKQTRATDAA